MTAFPRLVVVPPSTDRATYLVRRFYPQPGDDKSGHPLIAVATGFAAGGGLELQKLAGLTPGDARSIVATATRHVADGPRDWMVSEKAGLIFKKPSLLRGMGDTTVPATTMATDGMGLDDLSTDLILDEMFMQKAGELLGGQELIAAIPKRGWLMVGRCQPGQLPVMIKFGQIADGICERGGRHALTKNCYFIKTGKLHGVSGQGYLSLITSRDDAWNL